MPRSPRRDAAESRNERAPSSRALRRAATLRRIVTRDPEGTTLRNHPSRPAQPLLLALGVGATIVVFVVSFLLDRNDDSAEPIAADRDAAISTASSPPALESAEPVAAAESERRDLAVAELPAPVDLDSCDRDLDLFGIVVDAAGAPIAGAELSTASFPRQRTSLLDVNSRLDVVLGPTTRSAVDGTFALRLSRGACMDLTARHAGFATTTFPKRQAGERMKIVLHPAARLVIESVDESGVVVAGVKIRLWRLVSTAFDHREAESGADGRATFDDLAPGSIRARLDHAVLGQPDWQTIEIEAGETRVQRVTLPTGRAIRGRVTDRATGKPIAGANIGSNWVCDRPVRSDADGHYVFPGWTGRGTDDLTALASGYGRKTLRVGDLDRIDFVLEPGDRVIGRIVGADGTPVADARVHALASSMHGDSQEIDTIAGHAQPDGSFLVEGLRRDLGHTLVVLADGHGRYLLDFLAHPAGPGTIDLGTIVLPAPRAISGRALDAAGAPLPGARVSLSGNNADRNRLVGQAEPMSAFYGRTESRETDDLGRFRFRDLSPGKYSLELRIEGRPSLRREVILTSEADIEDVNLRIESGRDLHVRIVDEAGSPIAGSYVTSHEPYVSVKTDETGLAILRGLPEIDTSLSASTPNSELNIDPFVGRPGGPEVRVVAYAVVRVEGVVVDEAGAPLEGIHLVASGPKNLFLSPTGKDGSFYFEAKHGEIFDVAISARAVFANRGDRDPTAERLRGTLRAIAAPSSGLVLVAREGVFDKTLGFLVVDPDHRPVRGSTVYLSRLDLSADYTATSDDQGRVSFPALEAGDYVATARSPNPDCIESEPSKVTTDAPVTTLRLRRGVPLSGIVVDSKGAAIPGASLTVQYGEGRQDWRNADAQGRFRIALAPDARVTIVASFRGSDQKTRRGRLDDVAPGGPEVTIRIEE